MSKDYFAEASSSKKLELSFDKDTLENCLDELEDNYLLRKQGKWFVPRVACSTETATRKLRTMTAGRKGYQLFPSVYTSNILFLDDERAWPLRRDVEFTGLKNIPPYLYFLIERILKGDVSAYFELQEYGNHIDLVPYEERLSMLTDKAAGAKGYDRIDEKIRYLKKIKRVYNESVNNEGYDFPGLRGLWESVCANVKINNLDYDIAKMYMKRRETE